MKDQAKYDFHTHRMSESPIFNPVTVSLTAHQVEMLYVLLMNHWYIGLEEADKQSLDNIWLQIKPAISDPELV